ncbi:excisionase family DNA-binding protein [Microlunatus sp. Y2014]|uniref:excisionase family DNA-binding protein n=1 Tax=Microlunatus sp. Y2014 TaxID=3418488 RepID=UPI003DA7438B
MSTVNAVDDMQPPRAEEAERLADVVSFIEAHEQRHGAILASRFYLSGPSEHDRVELTEQLHAILKEAARALSCGQSISILARDQEISTQQAAEILGLSRPTVVRLVDQGELPAHVPGKSRRKLRLTDVLAFRDELHARRSTFVADSSAECEGDRDERDDVSRLLEEARRTV